MAGDVCKLVHVARRKLCLEQFIIILKCHPPAVLVIKT